MRQQLKTIMITILWISLLFTPAVFAEGVELEIFPDGEEAYQGEDVTFVVRFRSDQAMESIDAEISYDHEKLEYRYGAGNAGHLSDGSGGLTDVIPMGADHRTYYLTFRALEEGEASLSIDFSEVLAYESGRSLGRPTGTLTIEIQPSEEKPPEEKDPVIPPGPIDPPDLQEDFIEWEYEGITYYIYRDGKEGSLPYGFTFEEIPFEEERIIGGKHKDEELVLIYAIPEGGGSRWYFYDEETASVFPYKGIWTDNEYILLDILQEIGNYTEKTIMIGEEEVIVLTNDDLPEGVYLVYALDRRGTPNYYFYDSHEDSMQRALIQQSEVLDYIEIGGEPDERGFPMEPIYFIGGIIALTVIGMLAVHHGGKKQPPSRRQRRQMNNETERGV